MDRGLAPTLVTRDNEARVKTPLGALTCLSFLVAGAMLIRVPETPASAPTDTFGKVRVQFFSPTLVRLEQEGPKGFEDRLTFTIQERPKQLKDFKRRSDGGVEVFSRGDIEVRVPSASALDGATVSRHGQVVYKYTGPVKPAFLPSPANVGPAFPVSDYPRIIPSKWGAVPEPASSGTKSVTSGWDLGNQAPDVYVFLPKDYAGLRKEFLSLTGPVALPPLYTFGFWQSRYHAYTEQTALETIDTFRKRDLPLDLFTVDTDWRMGASHGYRVNESLFPDMKRFLQEAHDRHVRVMFNDHPEPQSDQALDPKEMQYRYDGLTALLGIGVDVWWYDRNWSTKLAEPAPGLPKEVWGEALFHDITQSFRPNQRPLIMTNVPGIDHGIRNYAPHPAAHRYPIWWTGDTTARWAYLQKGVANAVDGGVESLLPYMSEDLGGHLGNPTPELYTRYLQYGCLSPITRVHCTTGETRDPWEFGEEAEEIVRAYAKLRYRLLPVIYEAARETYEDGTPVVRRCDLEWPELVDARVNDQYLLGRDLLVAPIQTALSKEAEPIPGELLHTPDGKPGVKGEYFTNPDVKGAPDLVRIDPEIRFDWGQGAPAPNFPTDNFSVRWTGKIGPLPTDGVYRFTTTSDDGVRLWIDGKPVIDKWKPMNHDDNVGEIQLKKGEGYDLRLEYFDSGYDAACTLQWRAPEVEAPTEVTRSVWIPPGQWQDLWDGQIVEGPKTIQVGSPLWHTPLWVRRGGLVLLAPEMSYTGERPWDTITVEAYPAAGSSETRELYEDDGISNGYLKSEFVKTPVHMRERAHSLELTVGAAEGRFPAMLSARRWVVRIHLLRGQEVDTAELHGQSVPFRVLRPVEPRTALDPVPLLGKGADVGKAGPVIEVDLGSLPSSESAKLTLRLRS